MSIVTPISTGWEFIETTRKDLPELTQAGKVDWLPAQVPGYVHLDLVRNGVIEHPFYRMAEAGCQWVDDTGWIYRTTFEFEASDEFPVRQLFFECLDTVCTVFLNGTKIASHDNAFLPLTVDVSEVLIEGENSLVVEFQSAVKVGTERMMAYFAKEGMEYPRANFYDRSFVRKPQYMFGWDWGPRLASCGIAGVVSLVERAAVTQIVDVWQRQEHLADGSVQVSVTVETDRELGDLKLEGSFWDDAEFWSLDFESTGTVHRASVVVADPVLWTVFDSEPHLYDLSVELYTADEEFVDSREIRVGLRTIELVRESDEIGESFSFKLNGESLYALGANWIPDHSFPCTVTRSQVREKIEAAKDMGMNMLRVWGGGLMESEDFYDACDEVGILVWQDFPYGCAYYPDDAEHQAVARKEAEFHIKRLRNRASLALWCGNNENHTMFDSPWGGVESNPPRYYGEHLYHGALQTACDELDPDHAYVASSPFGKDESKATEGGVDHFNHNMGFVGDSHYWDVWHGRGDWKFYKDSNARFSSEFGFASAPSMEVFEEFISRKAFLPFSDEVNWHNKTRKPIAVFMDMVHLHYPQIETVEDLVYCTQLNQRDAMRFGIEHWRTSNFCMGALIWQLNDCWPVQSWALMDSFGHWKAAAYELRRLFSGNLISLRVEGDTVSVLDTHHNEAEYWDQTIRVVAYDLRTGEVLREAEFAQQDMGDGTAVIGSLSTKGLDPGSTLIVAEDPVDDEVLAWQLLGEPKDFVGTICGVTVARLDDNLVMVRTDGPVVDLWLREPENGTQFGYNFLTSGQASTWLIETDGPVESLVARSILGYHSVEMTNSPL